MLLRPRQKLFVERSIRALDEHGNTLGVAPTGAGKTIMLSSVVGRLIGDTPRSTGAKACVLAHRDELIAQNRSKFGLVNPRITTSAVGAQEKSWAGQVTFAMAPTLARASNLDLLPALDLLVIDEAHHAAADRYRRILDTALRRNPMCRIYGVTATPNRGDKRALRPVFSNVADQIRIGELIASGHLVPPRTFVIDVGVQDQLGRVRRTAEDFDMAEVEAIMNRSPVTEAIIRHWREKAQEAGSGRAAAGDGNDFRQTVVFCSTASHARNVTAAFHAAGVTAGLVHADMSETERRQTLSAYASGDMRVIVNVAVLTEGWDHPPTSCVVLLRPSSCKSAMIQMIGRGLRTVSPEEYPGIVKTDCIVLDFGTSTLLHGSIELDADLNGCGTSCSAPGRDCPECGAVMPSALTACPLCGHHWGRPQVNETLPLGDFVMSEIDLLQRSHFRWCDLFGDDSALLANGFNAWGGVFFLNGRWYGIGGLQKQRPHLLAMGGRAVCLAAADDWLNVNETDQSVHKTRRWLNQPPTGRQFNFLPPEYRQDFGLTRYQASALLAFRFNRDAIRSLVFGAAKTTSFMEGSA